MKYKYGVKDMLLHDINQKFISDFTVDTYELFLSAIIRPKVITF